MQLLSEFSAISYLILGITVFVVVVGLILFIIYCGQEHRLFVPERLAPDHQFAFPFSYREFYFSVLGRRLNGIEVHAQKPSKGTILYFHGNAGSLTGWGPIAAEIARRTGFDVRTYDYNGYGKSEGVLENEEQFHAAAEKFYEIAKSELPQGLPLIIYGRSMGSGPATRLASHRECAALILETPFASLYQLAREVAPYAPLFLLKYKFRSDQVIAKVKASTLILHGDRDLVVPWHHGRKLADLSANAELVTFPGAGHSDLGNHEEYWSALDTFLEKLAANNKRSQA